MSVGDRANDIFDFLHNANRLGWKHIERARHDRKVEIDGEQTRLFPWIRRQTAKCTSKLYVKARGEEFSGEVTLEITWVKAKLFPPGNTSSVATEEVTYIRVLSLIHICFGGDVGDELVRGAGVVFVVVVAQREIAEIHGSLL